MFSKISYDRNAFDRSVSSEGISLTAMSYGEFGLRIMVKTPFNGNLNGVGACVLSPKMQQQITQAFDGIGRINDTIMIFQRRTTAAICGQGSLAPNFVFKTPMSMALSGSGGVLIDSRMFFPQRMQGSLSGTGVLDPKGILKSAIVGELSGASGMSVQTTILSIPLNIFQSGEGEIILRRLSGLNENAIELIDIDLLPGETLTIDTDLLQVLFGSTEDVSSVTHNSVFFELNPGDNELIVDMDSETTMDVTVIWQNRWL